MKNLDLLSKRILSVAIALGIVLCSISMLFFSLGIVSKSYAIVPKRNTVAETPIIIDNYQIFGFDPRTNSAVGFNKSAFEGSRIKEFK